MNLKKLIAHSRTNVEETLSEITADVTRVYEMVPCPLEQIEQIDLARLVETRFVTVDHHNEIVDKLQRELNRQNTAAQVAIAEACGWIWDKPVPGAWCKNGTWCHLLPEIGKILADWKEEQEKKVRVAERAQRKAERRARYADC